MIGIGGTVRAAHKLANDLFSLPRGEHNIKTSYIRETLHQIKNNETGIYRTIYKCIPERALTITTGLMILSEAIGRFDCDRLFVSDYGIREGYLIDRVLKGEVARDNGSCGGKDVYAKQGAVVAEIQ